MKQLLRTHQGQHGVSNMVMYNTDPKSVQKRRLAFARVEALWLVVIACVLCAILLAITPYQRRQGMLNRDLANLRQMGAWTANYANDFEDLLPAFTGAPNSTYPDIRALATGSPLRQATGQAIDIIRRRSGRNSFPIPGAWIPHVLYTHLVLEDYADLLLPSSMFVSAGDKHRLNWLDDPINKHDQGFWQPFQNPSGGSGPIASSQKRWPYAASYQFVPATFDQNQSRWDEPWQRLSQTTHNSYSVPNVPLGGMKQSDVSYPGQKVMLHDAGAWHFSKQPKYFAHETARVVVLMGDGSADAKASGDANKGWNPTNPVAPAPAIIGYSPRLWEPPNTEPSVSERLSFYYRWTRGGLKGRDFDGPEIDTGQK